MNKYLEQFNFKKAARELGVSIWQTPNFLFLTMGVVIATTMVILFYITKDYSDPKILLMSECFISVTMLAVGSSIINRTVDIARINKLKTRFLELASNRLKDPLATMRWELEVLMERTEGNLNEKQREVVDSIIESNESMINLVKDLLDVVRIEDLDVVAGEDLINVDALLKKIMYEQKNYADSKKIAFEYENAAEGEHIKGNKKLLKVALENIVSNAIRFNREEERVTVKAEKSDRGMRITVRDRGYGIPGSEQEYIFSKFFRASNILAHNIEGTGLGLYVVKKIIDGSGGHVWFKSREGEGTSFYLELPLYNPEAKR